MKLSRFRFPVVASIAGLILCYFMGNGMTGVISAAILALLEISISFDNAIVNATILKKMAPKWRRRFLTWGMLIAVFGMRIVFPLMIVAFALSTNPWHALQIAIHEPNTYAQAIESVHFNIDAFGGCFLFLVSLNYFFDHKKEIHWIRPIEKKLSQLGLVQGIPHGLTLITLLAFSNFIKPPAAQTAFLKAGIYGILCFVTIRAIEHSLGDSHDKKPNSSKSGWSTFLYLEILDASFSFDGVIGAFAITHQLFVIAIGLGIGAFFVRSLTLSFIESDTLEAFPYLEHGAFYAIGSLSLIMLFAPVVEIPDLLTGIISISMIVISFVSSIRAKR